MLGLRDFSFSPGSMGTVTRSWCLRRVFICWRDAVDCYVDWGHKPVCDHVLHASAVVEVGSLDLVGAGVGSVQRLCR